MAIKLALVQQEQEADPEATIRLVTVLKEHFGPRKITRIYTAPEGPAAVTALRLAEAFSAADDCRPGVLSADELGVEAGLKPGFDDRAFLKRHNQWTALIGVADPSVIFMQVAALRKDADINLHPGQVIILTFNNVERWEDIKNWEPQVAIA